MKTKQRILEMALRLFNQHGLEATTTRQVALALNMSQGNFCYHFPQRSDLVEALYFQLVEALNTILAEPRLQEADFLPVIRVSYQVASRLAQYKFLMLNFVQVMRQYPVIKGHFQALFQQRCQQFEAIFKLWIFWGWLEPEPRSGWYRGLIEQMYLLGDFWLSEAEILDPGPLSEQLVHYQDLMHRLYWPYLTPVGQDTFQKAWATFLTEQAASAGNH